MHKMRTLAALLIEANKNNEIDQTCRRSERRGNIRGDCMARCIGHVNWSVSQSVRPSDEFKNKNRQFWLQRKHNGIFGIIRVPVTNTCSFAGNLCKTYFRSCEILKLTPPPPLAPSPHLFFTPKWSSHQSLCFCSIHATAVFVNVCVCEILHPTPLNTYIVYRQWNPGNCCSKSSLNSIIFILKYILSLSIILFSTNKNPLIL